MPDFQTVFDYVIANEGKLLENVPGDTGGLTWWGISRNNNPSWAGWALIDAHIQTAQSTSSQPFKEAAMACYADPVLENLTMEFYQDAWKRGDFEAINYDEMALQLFDKSWNMGGIAIKLFQVLLKLNPDGIIGPDTVNTFNALQRPNQSAMVDQFLAWAKAHHEEIVAKHPGDMKFLRGWENRDVRSDK